MNTSKTKSNAAIWATIRAAANGRAVLIIGAFASGAGTAIVLLGRPAILTSEHSADWASAFASFIAALVALGLGLQAARRDGRRDKDKTHGASLVFYNNVSETIAFLEVIEDNKEATAASGAAAEHLRSEVLKIEPLLSADVLEFLPHLPEHTAKLVVLSAQRISSMKQRFSIDRPHKELASELEYARAFLASCFIPLGNRLFAEIFGSGFTPPWRDPSRRKGHEA